MLQLVFYWMGDDITIPSILVKSIKSSNNDHLKIIQISDYSTKEIDGVDKILRIKKTKNILMDRLSGYSKIETKNNQTIFFDADTIVLKKLDLNIYEPGIYLYRRTKSAMFNQKYNYLYPELANKQIIETMPFLAGIVFIIDEYNFFRDLYISSKNLSVNLKKWYGDQVLIKQYYEENISNLKHIKPSLFNVIEREPGSKIQLDLRNKYLAVTFKGITKNYIEQVFNALNDNNFFSKN